MKETDIIIIEAGPTGLFAVFEAGLLRLKYHLVDTLPQAGGQLTELYPKKLISDIPGYPSVGALELADSLMGQIEQYQPEFILGEAAMTLTKNDDGTFIVTANTDTQAKGKTVAIADGLGTFEPRRPKLENIAQYEGKGVTYFVKNPESYTGKHIVITGGGDSTLNWSIYLAGKVNTASVTLMHRRNEFKGALGSIERVKVLKAVSKIDLKTPYEVVGLVGENQLEKIVLEQEGGNKEELIADTFVPLFGLASKLGPIATWGVEIEKNAIKVNDALDHQTCIEGVYTIGDINTYPGKLKLVLCDFHEATLMCQSVYNRIHPNKKYVLKYTIVVDIDDSDGTRKETEEAVMRSIG